MSQSTSASSQRPNLEDEKAALLRREEEARRAHFATDADALLADDADSVVLVREGMILPTTRAELTRIIADDMQGATYHEWDLLEDPIVRIADDASLAWVISRRKVLRTKQQPDGTAEEQQFIYAGINVFEKRDGVWTRVANASTFNEDEEGGGEGGR